MNAPLRHFDVNRIRQDFPILAREVYGKPLVYLDNAASAQKPEAVIEAMTRLMREDYANVHRGLHYLANASTEAYEAARESARRFLNAAHIEEVLFTRSSTGALNTVASSLGQYLKIQEGDEVRSTGELLRVPVGDAMIGRVVDPLGNPLDGKGPIITTETRPMESTAPGVAGRQPVKQPLQTGIKAIDAMTPIGRGQRELIIGDRKTGKTAIAIDAVINQKQYWGTPDAVVCIYVAVGQKESTVAATVDTLKKYGAMDYAGAAASV